MDTTIDYKLKYEQLAKLVADMMNLQKLYFKGRDIQVLSASKAKEKEVRDFINPPKKDNQLSFEFLAK